MICCLENLWILLGKLVSSCVLGSFLGVLLLRREFGEAFEGAAKASRKAAGFAVLTGSFFTLTVLLQGNIGVSALRDWMLFVSFLNASLRDLKSFEIPGKTLPEGVVLWFLWLIVGGLFGEIDAWAAFSDGALSAAVTTLLLLILTLGAEYLLRKEILGGGDIKLVFMVMLHLGFCRGFLCLVLALFSGLIFLIFTRQKRFPFAPSITAGAALSMLLGAALRNPAMLSASF